MLGPAVHDFLADGLSVGERVYPLALPEDPGLPAIVYRVVSDEPTVTHSDAQDSPTWTGIRTSVSRVQFDCLADTYDDAEALRDELVQLAVGYRGMWGDLYVDSVIPDLRVDDWDEDPVVYRVIQDLMIGHRAVPTS